MKQFAFPYPTLLLGLLLGLLACRTTQTSPPGPPVAPGPDPARNQELVAQRYVDATTQLIRGDLRAARDLFEEVLDLAPGHLPSQYQLARIALEERDYPVATTFAQAAVTGEPDNFWYHRALQQAYEYSGNYPQAIKVQSEITRRFPDRHEEWLRLSELYLRNKQPSQALTALDALDARTGESEESAQRRLRILEQQGDETAALAATETLIRLNPLETRYYEKRYDLLMKTGQEAVAIQTLEALLDMAPDNGFAMLALADYYKAQDDMARSDQYLFQAFANPEIEVQGKMQIIQGLMAYVESDPSLRPRIQRLASLLRETHPGTAAVAAIQGKLFALEGVADSARYYLRQAVQAEPANIPLWQDLLQADRQALDFPALLDDANEALEFYPNQESFLYFLGVAGERTGQAGAARNALRKLQRLGTAEPLLQARGQATLALVEQAGGQTEAAETAMTTALARHGQDPEVLAAQARYLRQGPEALAAIRKALALQPGHPEFVDIYAQVLLRQGSASEAVAQLEPLVRQHPRPLLLEHYGDALYRAGQTTEARIQWERALRAGAQFDLNAKLQQE